MNPISRRKFFQQAGAAGLLVTGPLQTAGFAQRSPNDMVNVAVMGIPSR